jgi:hypothetical protein
MKMNWTLLGVLAVVVGLWLLLLFFVFSIGKGG